jgi:hypothetical protein
VNPLSVENARDDVVAEPPAAVNIALIRAISVVVALVFPAAKRMLVDMPFAAGVEVDHVPCETVRTSSFELVLPLNIEAERTGEVRLEDDVDIMNEAAPFEKRPPCPTFMPFRTYRLFPISALSQAVMLEDWRFPTSMVGISMPARSTMLNWVEPPIYAYLPETVIEIAPLRAELSFIEPIREGLLGLEISTTAKRLLPPAARYAYLPETCIPQTLLKFEVSTRELTRVGLDGLETSTTVKRPDGTAIYAYRPETWTACGAARFVASLNDPATTGEDGFEMSMTVRRFVDVTYA